jgi:hypothetical protein
VFRDRGEGTQLDHARYHALRLFIDRYKAFGMELAERHTKRHLLFADLWWAIQGKIDAALFVLGYRGLAS